MHKLAIFITLLCSACSVAEQPKSNQTVAAYEVPLPTKSDKEEFLILLKRVANAEGYHVDAASASELEVISQVSPITFNASVWRGDDDELMASAMDFQDRIGCVWIAFPKGEDPSRSKRFRDALISQIGKTWPDSASLPIMPSGAIPLTHDLNRTPSGYAVKPSEQSKYQDKTQ